MQARTLWRLITMDNADFLERLLTILDDAGLRYCVIGGQGVNAYADPVVSLDLDLAIGIEATESIAQLFPAPFRVERFDHSINVSLPDSQLRAQFQTDPRYGDFVDRASRREILGVELPVATVDDILRGKLWAVQDVGRRPSKRQKDLADISRLIEAEPRLTSQVPREILDRLF